MIKLEVANEHADQRLDRFLARALPAFSRARLQTLIRDGFIRVNGNTARPRDPVRAGQIVELREPEIAKIEAQPESMA
ncbi:MAG TPA: S4 domain-containing protein, partial [Chthoniobacterales bacterium]